MKSVLSFATATTADAEKISKVLEKAFNVTEERKGWLDSQIKMFLENPSDWRTISINKQLIGTVHIRKQWLKIGKSKILKGDVGGVSILPEYHGKGYGSALLADTVKWMRKENYDISRLGGLVDFYSRFGYLRFPRRYVEFSVGHSVSAGASIVQEGKLEIPRASARKIRPYDRAKDFRDYVKLYNRFNKNYNGFSPLSEKDEASAAGPSIPDPLKVVFIENGKMLGYLFASRHPAELNKSDRSVGEVTIGNIAYEKKKPEVLDYLIKYINNFACETGLHIITARIPFDPEITDVISRIPIQFQCSETYGGKASNMLQVINLKSLLERLIPEFEARLKNSAGHAWRGRVHLEIEKEQAQLAINKGRIRMTDEKETAVRVILKETELLRLVLGMFSFEETESATKRNYAPEVAALLNALFPRKVPTSWNWC